MPGLGLSSHAAPQPSYRRPPPSPGSAARARFAPTLVGEGRFSTLDGQDDVEEEPALSAVRRAALSAFSVAILTVQRGGRVLDANAAAEALLAQGRLLRRGGVLTTANGGARTLEQLIWAATDAVQPRCGAMRVEHEDGSVCLLSVTPLDGGPGRPPLALVVAHDLACAPAPNPAHLQAMFGLTVAEADLAVLFGQGLCIAEVADLRGVSAGTVKSQLKAITAKLGVSRQAEIAVLIASMPKLVRR